MKKHTILLLLSLPLFADFNSCMQEADLLMKSNVKSAYNKYKSCYSEVDSKKGLIRFFGSMAISAKKLGKKYEAGSYLDRLRTIDPSNSWVKRSLKKYVHNGIELNGKLYPIYNESYQDYINRADSFNDNNQLSLAYINYLKALSMASTKRELIKALGALTVVSNRLDRADEARVYLNRILKISPNNRWANSYLSKIGSSNQSDTLTIGTQAKVVGLSDNKFSYDGYLSVRKGPSTRYEQIGELFNGDIVDVLDKKGKWYHIKSTQKDIDGWVYGKYLSKSLNTDTLAQNSSSASSSSYSTKKIEVKGFEKTFGGSEVDKAYAITQTNDGGFIVAGYTSSFGNGNGGVYLIKIDKDGNKVWQKTFGGEYTEMANAITKTDDGGFIVAGKTSSFGKGGEDVYLIKIDKDGNKIWQKTFGGSEDDGAYAITPTDDGGFIVAGYTESFGNVWGDVYLFKIDKDGNKIWQEKSGGFNIVNYAQAITPTDDGGFIVAGWTRSFGNGKGDVYLIKIDKNGNKIWQKTFGGSDYALANAITSTNDGGFIVAGRTNSFGNRNFDVYLIKIDKDGNKIWQKTFGGSKYDEADAITQTNDGGFIVAGYTESFGNGGWDVYLIKIDKDGNKIWQKTFGGSGLDGAYAITPTDDGGFIVVGYTYSFGNRNFDVYLIKIDKDGNINR